MANYYFIGWNSYKILDTVNKEIKVQQRLINNGCIDYAGDRADKVINPLLTLRNKEK